MKTVKTYTANIYLGLKDRASGQIGDIEVAPYICKQYVDKVGLCVSFTQTHFIYTDGCEPGIIVGLINYPRFPSSPKEIKEHAIELAKKLKIAFLQERVSIVMDDETIMLG